MLLWMIFVAGELTGSHYFSANGWLFFTIACWCYREVVHKIIVLYTD